jgi:hypothetical protein
LFLLASSSTLLSAQEFANITCGSMDMNIQ